MRMVGAEGRREWGPRSCGACGLFLRTVGITGGFKHQIDGHGPTYVFKETGGLLHVAWTRGTTEVVGCGRNLEIC